MSRLFGKLTGVVIENVEDLEPKMELVIQKLNLTQVSRCFHQFKPFGATGVILLAESHFAMHTYPEHSIIYFDLFCCTPGFDSSEAACYLSEIFESTGIKWESMSA
jgi:S-adenosylmethionine decarboxylase proenzyme